MSLPFSLTEFARAASDLGPMLLPPELYARTKAVAIAGKSTRTLPAKLHSLIAPTKRIEEEIRSEIHKQLGTENEGNGGQRGGHQRTSKPPLAKLVHVEQVSIYSDLQRPLRQHPTLLSTSQLAVDFYFPNVLTDSALFNTKKLNHILDPPLPPVPRGLSGVGLTEPLLEISLFHTLCTNFVSARYRVPVTTLLTDFLRKINCLAQTMPQAAAVAAANRSFVYIEGTFYLGGDTRDLERDITKGLRKEHEKVSDLANVRFIDLPQLRLWKRYCYRHLGTCEHTFLIHDVIIPDSSYTQSAIVQTFSSVPGTVVCDACEKLVAVVAVYYNREVPLNPQLMCKGCHRAFNSQKDTEGTEGGDESGIYEVWCEPGDVFTFDNLPKHRATYTLRRETKDF